LTSEQPASQPELLSRSSQAARSRFWKNVDSIDTLQYARNLAQQRANLPADFDQATVISASDFIAAWATDLGK